MKNFRIRERNNFQFRAEFFNFFNHVNLGAPGLSIQAPNTFGVITTSVQGAFGSQLMVGGFILNNQLTDFDYVPVVGGNTDGGVPGDSGVGEECPLGRVFCDSGGATSTASGPLAMYWRTSGRFCSGTAKFT